jgi:hypothetical protein
MELLRIRQFILDNLLKNMNFQIANSCALWLTELLVQHDLSENMKDKLGSKVHTFHCTTQYGVFRGKIMRVVHISKRVVSMSNFIRARGLGPMSSTVPSFLLDIDSKYEDLPYYIEIFCFSSRKTWKEFHDLKRTMLLYFSNYKTRY